MTQRCNTTPKKPHKAPFKDWAATEAAADYSLCQGGYLQPDGAGFKVRRDAFLAGCQWHRENCCEASRKKESVKDG